jgi:KipI family sensor histidine kinase inhibitor
MKWPIYQPLGDQGLLISYENKIDPGINEKIRFLSNALEGIGFPWLMDINFSFRCLLVLYDPDMIRYPEVVAAMREIEVDQRSSQAPTAPIYEIPTVYGGQHGPDLSRVAEVTGLSSAEVIDMFSSTIFTIYFLGFLGAQPHLGGLPEELHAPRLDTPRLHVPKGSVGMGGIQAGVITIDQPSGFNYIGRTFLSLYNPLKIPPTPFKAGDQIIFPAISENQIQGFRGKDPVPGGRRD